MTALPSYDERRARGRAARERTPRSSHDALGNVARDPIELLERNSAGRVEALVALRYGRMLASPFAFFRGSAILQAHDLAATPDSGIHMQICGDCHLANFGGFATPERTLIFDLNDFDETADGPWEWDLKRLVASFTVAGRYLGHGSAAADGFAFAAVQSYQLHMLEYARMAVLDVWYERISFDRMYETVQSDDARRRIKRGAARAAGRTHETALPKLAEREAGGWRIRDAPPSVFHVKGESTLFTPKDEWMQLKGTRNEVLEPVLREYIASMTSDRASILARFSIQDLAFKVVGVGSVGTRCLIILLIDSNDKPLFLQLKEASASVVSMFFDPRHEGSTPRHDGQRVVSGQRLMQAATDPFLGWSTGPLGRAMYVRQLRDMKVSVEIELFDSGTLQEYAALCGWALARAHAKASGAAAEIAGYLGRSARMADTLVLYGRACADQVDRDFEVFRAACRSGRVLARTDAELAQDFAP